MRMTKKITSIVLAVMMVVSMMSVMAVTANAEVGDYVAEEDYLTFTAETAGSTVTLKVNSGGSNLQYDLNGTGLTAYTAGTTITLASAGDYVRFRGKDTRFGYSNHVAITGKVACSGNVMSLLLDDNGKSQGLSNYCFESMFEECTGLTSAPELPETMLAEGCYGYMFYGCTNLTTAPKLPATMLAEDCYSAMFNGCTNLTVAPVLPATTLAIHCYTNMFSGCGRLTAAPELPATSLAPYCYGAMFAGCGSLTTAPELPATTLERGCYSRMFYGCSSIKLSETKTAEYSIPYSVPSGGNGTTASNALDNMFTGTGGTFTGTPEINKTYYRPAKKYTVTWKNGDTVIETDTDAAEGTTPTYNGTAPTKAADDSKHYAFSGWFDGSNTYAANALPEVSGDVTYTAQFSEESHAYTLNPTFNWTQDASTGDWDCDTLTLSCSCGATQDTNVAGVLGATNVKCTADANGDFTYKISKKISGVTYEDTKTLDANGVVKSVTQLKAAAAKGGSWELGNDIDRVINVKCANGFVLDGKNYTVTRPDGNSNYPVFVAADKNAGFTLKNLTIDGVANTINARPAIASSQKSGNSGDVINLDNVTITNWDFDASNNGAILAYGYATVNMTNCNIDTDSDYDVWGGAASTVNVSGGEVGTVYLNGGTATAELTNDADVDNIVAFAGNTITADSGSNITPPADYKVKDNGDGTYSIVPKEYVAQVGETKYESLAEAYAAAADGDTITVLDDIDLGTSKINVKKNVNFDLGGKKITGSGAAIFVVYPNKTVSIENGTIENTATTSNHYTIVGNASTVNLGDGAKLAGGYQTYSGAAGAVLNVNAGSTIENTTSFGAAIYNNAVLNVNGGTIKAAVPITTLGTSGNGGYEINITAGTVESTDEIAIYHVNAGELNITGGTIKGGSEAAVLIKSGTTEISGGTFTSDGEAVKYDSTGSGYAPLDKIEISGGTFSNDVDIYAAPGYVGTQLSDTTFGVKVDTNPLGLAPIIGFQKKITGNLSGNDIGTQGVRIVTKVEGCDLTQFDEYGYVVAKVTGKEQANANFNHMKAYGGNGEKTIKCNGSVNTIDGLGTPYVTLAVNGMNVGDQVAARFYAIKNGVTYYSNYVSTARYNGIIATY